MGVNSRVKYAIKKRSRALFRNNQSLKLNFLYTAHKYYSKVFSRINPSAADRKIAENIRTQGFGIVGKAEVSELEKIVREEFLTVKGESGFATFPREKNSLLAPHIFRAVMEHKGAIEAFFGSHFHITWFDCVKITPGYQPPTTSFGYHTDDTPSTLVKLFIYITDTYKNNGAFRTFNYEITDGLIKKGILATGSPGEKREKAQALVTSELEKNLNIIEGEKGTMFIFDNNLIHKATLPLDGERIHVSMELIPSSSTITLEEMLEHCNEEIKEYFPRNPFNAGPK